MALHCRLGERPALGGADAGRSRPAGRGAQIRGVLSSLVAAVTLRDATSGAESSASVSPATDGFDGPNGLVQQAEDYPTSLETRFHRGDVAVDTSNRAAIEKCLSPADVRSTPANQATTTPLALLPAEDPPGDTASDPSRESKESPDELPGAALEDPAAAEGNRWPYLSTAPSTETGADGTAGKPGKGDATYMALLEWLVRRRPVAGGLERVRHVLRMLGDPQDALPVVHVAGTNGKGSVCAKVARGLHALLPGCRVGLTMSPHLATARERIAVNGAMIEPRDFVHAMGCVLRAAHREGEAQNLSFFEIVTLAAFHYFYYGPEGNTELPYCAVAVVETGLGGRRDATNAVKAPACSVLTSIGNDHSRLLGATPELIAEEKVQIAKPGCRFVLGPHAKGDAAAVVERVARERGVSSFERIDHPREDEDFDAENTRIAAAALKAVCEQLHVDLPVDEDEVSALVAPGTPPCRFQVFTKDGGSASHGQIVGPVNSATLANLRGLVVDVAHNEVAFARLAQRLEQLREGGNAANNSTAQSRSAPLVIAVALSKDRSHDTLAPLLELKNCTVFLVDGQHALLQRRDRERRPDERLVPVPVSGAALPSGGSGNLYYLGDTDHPLSLHDQLEEIVSLARTQGAWVPICGSFFVVREALAFFGSEVAADEAETRLFEGGWVDHAQLVPMFRADVSEELSSIFGWKKEDGVDETLGIWALGRRKATKTFCQSQLAPPCYLRPRLWEAVLFAARSGEPPCAAFPEPLAGDRSMLL